jgi:hypothetical protein
MSITYVFGKRKIPIEHQIACVACNFLVCTLHVLRYEISPSKIFVAFVTVISLFVVVIRAMVVIVAI